MNISRLSECHWGLINSMKNSSSGFASSIRIKSGDLSWTAYIQITMVTRTDKLR
jgi:hypothetical protein